ncbi:unnamed protein product [Urochloa decumbens]|uniref:Uncharacterized protein n=1 Tax=Urochloa decumbens TaxID=240449 RepID=A0ABC9FUM4_9POAL
MVMPPRSCSSGMQSIRRELQRRRPKPLAPKRSAITKQSAPPPRPQLQEDPSPAAAKSPPGSVGTHAPRPPRPRPHAPPRPAAISRSTPPPPPPPLHASLSSTGSAIPSTLRADDEHLRPGTEVGVRTRTTNLRIGRVLVLWLRATIASQTNGGYGVVYDGNWPPVYVPRRHVRKIQPSPSPTTPPPSLPLSCAPSSSVAVAATLKKEMRPPPRPTTAGKSLRLIRRSLLPEMEGKNQAALLGY